MALRNRSALFHKSIRPTISQAPLKNPLRRVNSAKEEVDICAKGVSLFKNNSRELMKPRNTLIPSRDSELIDKQFNSPNKVLPKLYFNYTNKNQLIGSVRSIDKSLSEHSFNEGERNMKLQSIKTIDSQKNLDVQVEANKQDLNMVHVYSLPNGLTSIKKMNLNIYRKKIMNNKKQLMSLNTLTKREVKKDAHEVHYIKNKLKEPLFHNIVLKGKLQYSKQKDNSNSECAQLRKEEKNKRGASNMGNNKEILILSEKKELYLEYLQYKYKVNN